MKAKKVKPVKIAPGVVAGGGELVAICGPCVIESEKLTLTIAERIAKIARRLRMPVIFKASYDKANRSSVRSYRGPGLEEGLAILRKVKERTGLPVTTDVHSAEQAEAAAAVVDLLQIPAFLCRQTDLLLAAGRTRKPVNVKKGQFLSPSEAGNIVDKIASTGNKKILLTERGTTFGYHNLVVDFRSLPVMRALGCPVVFDATHSVQLPGGRGEASGGQGEFVPAMIRAAVAVGCDALFVETHPRPRTSPSDGENMLPLDRLEENLRLARKIHRINRER